jgi:hypothetical protein
MRPCSQLAVRVPWVTDRCHPSHVATPGRSRGNECRGALHADHAPDAPGQQWLDARHPRECIKIWHVGGANRTLRGTRNSVHQLLAPYIVAVQHRSIPIPGAPQVSLCPHHMSTRNEPAQRRAQPTTLVGHPTDFTSLPNHKKNRRADQI